MNFVKSDAWYIFVIKLVLRKVREKKKKTKNKNCVYSNFFVISANLVQWSTKLDLKIHFCWGHLKDVEVRSWVSYLLHFLKEGPHKDTNIIHKYMYVYVTICI